MTLENLNYLAQTVAAVAILVSLVFVGLQLRQTSAQIEAHTRSIKASAGFEATHSWATLNEHFSASPDEHLRLALKAHDPKTAWEDLSDVERVRASLLQRAVFQKLEGLYYLHRYGSLDDAIWETRRHWCAATIKVKFWARWWALEKTLGIYSPDFVAAIDAAREAVKIVPWNPADFLAGTGAPDDGAAPP